MTSPGRTWKNEAEWPNSAAAARASIVLPQPGGPYSSKPPGLPRTPENSEGSATAGHTMASWSAAFAASRPMTFSNLTRRPRRSTSTSVDWSSAFSLARLSASSSSLPSVELADLLTSFFELLALLPKSGFWSVLPVWLPMIAWARSCRSSASSLVARLRCSSSCDCSADLSGPSGVGSLCPPFSAMVFVVAMGLAAAAFP
mmetsp:Transcript_39190/g.101369  ORF Transcript_39190/g.101369 Transcript_39190/m.101369 type:complete len:201 (-) Transcript_39190:641-1243(-)